MMGKDKLSARDKNIADNMLTRLELAEKMLEKSNKIGGIQSLQGALAVMIDDYFTQFEKEVPSAKVITAVAVATGHSAVERLDGKGMDKQEAMAFLLSLASSGVATILDNQVPEKALDAVQAMLDDQEMSDEELGKHMRAFGSDEPEDIREKAGAISKMMGFSKDKQALLVDLTDYLTSAEAKLNIARLVGDVDKLGLKTCTLALLQEYSERNSDKYDEADMKEVVDQLVDEIYDEGADKQWESGEKDSQVACIMATLTSSIETLNQIA